MANKYYKNFILWGEVDFYCLICEESFQDLAELDRHIRWENHRKLLKTQVKCHKFKKEVIYKVGELYYCEVCNFVSSSESMDMMNLHIASNEHKTTKQKPKTDAEIINNACKRDSDYVIVKDVIVEEIDWHCVTHIENYCLVCGIYLLPMLAYVVEHIKTPRHLINLIACRVVVDEEKLYRKLYGDFFYCLVCKEAIPKCLFECHWTEKEHCDFRNHCIFKMTYANANATNAKEEMKLKIERGLIAKVLKAHYDILEEKESAICNQCHYVVKLDFKTMNDHKKNHVEGKVENPQPSTEVPHSEKLDSSSEEDVYEVVFCELTDHGRRRRELAKYGQTNYIKLNSGGSKGYCNLCCTTISGHLKLFKEHVRGARHRGHLELKGFKKSKTHKSPSEKFKMITEIINNVYFSEPLKLICLNREVCIDVYSFILVYPIDKRFQYKRTKCLICEINYPYGDDFEHYGTEEHKKRWLASKVLPKEGEFVREIRPDVFHCGVCNKIYPFWESMEKHLISKPHINAKNYNKYKVFEKETFDEKLSRKSSKTPDILYVQLLTIGIVKSKSVESVKDMLIGDFQSLKATQVKNAGVDKVKATQGINAGVDEFNANACVDNVNVTQVTKADINKEEDIQVTNAGLNNMSAIQATIASADRVRPTQVTNAGVDNGNATQVINSGVQELNANQVTKTDHKVNASTTVANDGIQSEATKDAN